MALVPYHVLVERVAELEQALEAARRDPAEYRRGYNAGWHAARRGAPLRPDGERRARGGSR